MKSYLMYLPILMIVGSNTIYHICAKSIPQKTNLFAPLAVAYLISSVVCFLLFHATSADRQLIPVIHDLKWIVPVIALCFVGLESGNILLYKFGWDVSLGPLVSHIVLAITLIMVGRLLFHEHISIKQLMGIALCIVGVILINKK